LTKNTALLEGTETLYVTESKYKEITNISSKDEVRQKPSKKTKEKQPKRYHGDAIVKIGGDNHCERYVCTR